MPGKSSPAVWAQAPPPKIGSKATPTFAESPPGVGAMVRAALRRIRTSPGAMPAQVRAVKGPAEGAAFGQVWVRARTPWKGSAPLPRR